MHHVNSVFHQISKLIPWSVFEASVEKHKADFRVRKLRTKDQFMALLYGQLAGAVSLREIENGLRSHVNRLYHVGVRPVSRSTLADANAQRSSEVYADVFKALIAQARPGMRRKLRGAIRLIDSTSIRLSSHSKNWVRGIAGCHMGKVHVVFDPVNALPLSARVTAQNVNDITPARALSIEDGATYVFDLGYYSYEWWHKLNSRGCHFVTRLTKTTQLRNPIAQYVPPGGAVLLDQIGEPPRYAMKGRSPYKTPLREIHVQRDNGDVMRLVTNDLSAPAKDISDLYKLRWNIELFFKWLKQNLKIKHFIGRGRNAVKTQIYIALIAFLLLRAAHQLHNSGQKLQAFTRLVRINIMHRKPINQLILKPDKNRSNNTKQMLLKLEQC